MSRLYIINQNKWTNSYEHTMDFTSASERDAWMQVREVNEFDTEDREFEFIEPNKSIKVWKPYDEVKDFSYCMFENNGRKYYAFITDVEYLNRKVQMMHIEIDVMMTYMFDYELGYSFVEREHQNRVREERGELKRNYSRTDEALDIGKEYLKKRGTWQKVISNMWRKHNYMCVLITTEPIGKTILDDDLDDEPITSYGITTRYSVYTVPVFIDSDERDGNVDGIPVNLIHTDGEKYQGATMRDIMRIFGNDNKVVSISLVPFEFFALERDMFFDPNNPDDYELTYENIDDEVGTQVMEVSPDDYFTDVYMFRINYDKFKGDFEREVDTVDKAIPAFEERDGETQKPFNPDNESKIFTHPYRVYNVYNNIGNLKEFRQENTEGDEFVFKYTLSLGAPLKEQLKLDSKNPYDLIINNQIHDLPLSNDPYLNYLQNNKATSITGMAIPALSTAVGVGMTATGIGAGAGVPLMVGGIMSGSATIGSQLARRYDIKNQPDAMRAGGNDAMFDAIADYVRYRMDVLEIDPQAKERIIQYFHRFGYKVNSFKTPNLRSRRNFNFIKTIETTLEGNLNTGIKEQIKTIYQRGITIWHAEGNDTGSDDPMFKYEFENYETDTDTGGL